MVFINKLTCKGFKSFANRTELVFGKSFNAIIGPNGSGKSNVMDSLCFVLGKSSAREMRAEKSSNLIYNGGKKGSPAKEAEVTIEFDNSQKEFPVDTPEIKISRIVKLNGNSVYKINDEVRTRQQVLDVLNTAKINPDGHNIILQGDIINFMTMKTTERREIIEEISGISMYEDKKQKCMLELNKVDAKLNEAEIILTEREANLRELKKERDQAIRYKELEENIKDHKATFIHLQIKDKEEKLSEVESRKKEADSKIQKTNETILEIKNKIQSIKEEIEKINLEVETKGEKDQLILRKDIEELKTNIVKINSRLEVCQNELTKINSRKEQLNNNIKEIELKTKELNSKKESNGKRLNEIKSEEQAVEKKIANFKQKHNIDAGIGNTLEELDKNIEVTLSELAKINEEKQNIIRNKDLLSYKLNSIEEKLVNIKGSPNDIEILKDKKKLFKELTEKLTKCLNQDSSYAAQLSEARHELNSCSEELAKVRARQIGIQERSLGDLAVRKTLELKNTLKGIHGTVSELGKVDSKFSTAMEVAAGNRIQSIVVESDIIAQKCIQNLKDNKLGIATFLPLNKIKSRIIEPEVKNLIKQKGVFGLATDIVRYDSKFADIFSYVLGSTLIIEDIETGRRLGIGRARMVTLEGDLLEPSGAMVGGYRIKRTGMGFMEKEIDESLSKLDNNYADLRKLIDHVENKKVENEVLITDLRQTKANLEAEIITLEKSFGIEGQDSTLLTEDKKSLLLNVKELDKQLLEFDNKIKVLNKSMDNSKLERQKVKEKLNDPEIAKSLESIEQEKLKIKEQYLEISGQIKNIDAQILTMFLPEIEKTKQIIKQHDKEFDDFSNEIKDLSVMLKDRNNELKTKEEQEKKFHNNLKDLIDKRHKFNEKIQGMETNLVREDEKLKGFEQKLNNISIDRAKIIAEFEGLQKEFEPYKEATIKRGLSLDDLKLKINESEKELHKIGNVNLRALEVYESIHEEYNKVSEKVIKIKSEKEDVLNMLNEIETSKKEIFMKTYKAISKSFIEIYKQIATKGEATINLENEENPFEGGIDIKIKIAGNKYLDMKSLSGGEKTLTALSFIFAIQEHSPSPFYLLDEVDAALDKRNSELLSKYISKYASKAQYIVISHNDYVITESDFIYGVSMQDGITKVLSLKV